jgi:hypothetical protein
MRTPFLVKRFEIKERHGISFRAEAYNVFINANFGPPNTDFKSSYLGKDRHCRGQCLGSADDPALR